NSEWHLVVAVDYLCRLPSPAARGPRVGQSAREAVSALDPDQAYRGQAEQGSCQRRGKDGKNGELHTEKRTYHGHQLYVTKAHPFHSAPAQVNCASTVNEGSTESRAQQGIKQGKQMPG